MKWHKLSDYAIRYGEDIPADMPDKQRAQLERQDPIVCKVMVHGEWIYEAWANGEVLCRSQNPGDAKAAIEALK